MVTVPLSISESGRTGRSITMRTSRGRRRSMRLCPKRCVKCVRMRPFRRSGRKISRRIIRRENLAVESLERVFHIFHKETKELSTKNTLNFTSRDAMIFMSKRWLQVVDKNDDIVWRPQDLFALTKFHGIFFCFLGGRLSHESREQKTHLKEK